MPIDYSKFDAIEDSDDEKEKKAESSESAPAAKKEAATCPNCCKDLSQTKALRCGKCKKVAYCSPKCQKEDWQFHKRNCSKDEPAKPKSKAAPEGTSGGYGGGARPRKEEKVVVDDDEDVGTWYRHREWRPEQKQDFKPTQIAAGAGAPAAAVDGGGNPQAGSAWNKAGTWEDSDQTEWAKARLPELLVGLKAELPGGRGTVEVQKVDNIDGDASISVVRGTARFLFDLTFHVHVVAHFMGAGGQQEAKATLKILEFTDSLAQAFAESTGFPCEVSAGAGGSVVSLREVLQDPAGLRGEVFRGMLAWVQEFQKSRR